jgi:hypothetical protein
MSDHDTPDQPIEPTQPSGLGPQDPSPGTDPNEALPISQADPVDVAPPPLAPMPSKSPAARYGIIAVIVLALAAGGIYVATKGSPATINASSPSEAVENMVSVAGQGRIVEVLRSEFPWIEEVGNVDQQALDAAGLRDGRIDGISLTGNGLGFAETSVGEDLAIVQITSGSFTYRIDTGKMPAAFKSQLPPGLPQTAFEQTIEVPAVNTAMCSSFTETDRECPGLSVVTVKDDDGWRVSWMHTFMHMSGAGELEPRNPNGAISAADLEDRLENAITDQDANAFFDLLDPEEFGWLSDFRLDMEEPPSTPPSVDLRFEVLEEAGDSAILRLAGFEATKTEQIYLGGTFELTEVEKTVVFDGDCISETGGSQPTCLSDLPQQELGPFESARPLLDQLAADGIRLGAVQRDGLWYLSLRSTLAPYSGALEQFGTELGELAQRCQSAFQGLQSGAFDPYASEDPFADVPAECMGLLAPFMGLAGGGSFGMTEQGYVPGQTP